jgi:hypothetical protein
MLTGKNRIYFFEKNKYFGKYYVNKRNLYLHFEVFFITLHTFF